MLEFCELGDLEAYLHDASRPLPLAPDLADVAQGIAEGLHFLHSQLPAVIHRDIKSPNVLLARVVTAGRTQLCAKLAGMRLGTRTVCMCYVCTCVCVYVCMWYVFMWYVVGDVVCGT